MGRLAAAASCLALVACGGKVGSVALPPFAESDGGASPVGQCLPCAANADCRNRGACATEGDAGGGGQCATGCTKEGFCLPGQVCKWVSDPLGATWRACLPSEGCSLGR
ncbi:MAG: hypothetical protein M3O36_10775 [Myxococcota bacterium]|nr:hypothetical protein [Myxococcota bacterium]